MTRPAASSIGKVSAECDAGEQLDGQNCHPTAGKKPEKHSKDIEQPRFQDDQAQDVVAILTIAEWERKVQNHIYQQLVLRSAATFMAGQPTPPTYPSPAIAGLIKG